MDAGLVYFFGIPVYFLALLALLIAILYAFIWPKKVVNNRDLSQYEKFILRWGHSLSWVFLALAGFSWGARSLGMASIFAIVGGLIYMFFMVVLSSSARPGRR